MKNQYKHKHQNKYEHMVGNRYKSTKYAQMSSIIASDGINDALQRVHDEILCHMDRSSDSLPTVSGGVVRPVSPVSSGDDIFNAGENINEIISSSIPDISKELGINQIQLSAYVSSLVCVNIEDHQDLDYDREDIFLFGKFDEKISDYILHNMVNNGNGTENIREKIGSLTIPIGLGWKNIYEYRYWLCKYGMRRLISGVSASVNTESKSHKLVEHAIKSYPDLHAQIYDLLVRLTLDQKNKYEEQGIRSRVPRSPSNVAERYTVTEQVAIAGIDLLKSLPENPLHDYYTRLKETTKREKNKQANIEFDVEVDEHTVSIKRKPNVQKIYECLKSEKLVKTMLVARVLARMSYKKQGDKDGINDLYRQLETMKINEVSESECYEYANMILEMADDENDAKLVDESAEFENTKDALCGNRVPLTKLRRLKSDLKRKVLVYDQTVLKIEYHYRITDKIVRHQQKYLSTERIEDIVPLTKAMVVKQLGFIPSSEKRKTNNKDKQNMGRRIERYIDVIAIELPGGKIMRLKELVPGCGGVKHLSGRHMTRDTIKVFIKRIIDDEGDKPYSDIQIKQILRENYGIRISRECVCKYRKDLGYPSSQERSYV